MSSEKRQSEPEQVEEKTATIETAAKLEDKIVETEHSVTIGGQTIGYRAIAGTLVARTEDGEKAKASVFFIAYLKQSVDDPSQRPLLVSFNGGPGSSSVWLHLGMLGPRRVLSGDVGDLQPPPYGLVDNEHSLLDVADILFIDPVSTGYSRPAPGEEAKQFHGVDEDIESVGDFIRLFVTRYGRWLSPKYLIGESYGTTRAAGLSGYLQQRHGLYLNGIALISVVLDFQTLRFTEGNDLPYVLYLPTYAATAWYHGMLSAAYQADLRTVLNEVEAFAAGEYAAALFKGETLTDDERATIAEKLARYTGLTTEYIEQTNLRIHIARFVKELLRHKRRTVGRLDSRFQGIDRDAAGEHFEYDPSYAAIQGSYTAALNDYVRRELGFESDLPYEILTGLYERWDYGKYQNQFLNVGETLRAAMSQNPHLRVCIANGYYDLATPYFATEYTINHLQLDPSLHSHIEMSYYEAGHMMYVHPPSLLRLNETVRRFIAGGQA